MIVSNDIDNAIVLNQLLNNSSGAVSEVSYDSVLQAELSNDLVPSLEDMWKTSFERHFNQPAGQTYYHVMDASSIQTGNWVHNDFPRGKFLTDKVDESVLTWKPTRRNPSQLDSDVQAKIQATLGKNAIVVPPELDEKMKTDPALRLKVMANIEKVYTFHAPRPYEHMTLPGTKFYGTRTYGSVIILDNDGNVTQSVVSSGGGFIGPDEHTLKQIEEEQARKLKRKAFNKMILQEYQFNHHLLLQSQQDYFLWKEGLA